MIQEADLNTDQEFSVCEVNSELQSYFHYAAQNENMIYLTITHVANIPGWFQSLRNFCIFYWDFSQNKTLIKFQFNFDTSKFTGWNLL